MAIPSDVNIIWIDLRPARAHAARGDHDGAIRAFTDIIQSVDRDVHCPKTGTEPPHETYCEAHYERGLAYTRLHKHDDAIKDFDAVIAEAKDAAIVQRIKKFLIDSHLQRGILAARKGDARRAIDDFSAVVRLNTHNSEAYYRRAIAHMEMLEPEQAQADFERASALDPFGFPKLQQIFVAKACVTIPDTRLRNTLCDQGTLLEPTAPPPETSPREPAP